MRKPAFCICENKSTDQLHGKCAATAPLFSLHSTIPLLPKSKFSSLWLSSQRQVFSGLAHIKAFGPKLPVEHTTKLIRLSRIMRNFFAYICLFHHTSAHMTAIMSQIQKYRSHLCALIRAFFWLYNTRLNMSIFLFSSFCAAL